MSDELAVIQNLTGSDEISKLEQTLIISKALTLVMEDLGCSHQEALFAICRDWMELRQIDLISPNQLECSTPVDFKATWWHRIKKYL
jgi:hypothetical protein